MFYEWKWKILNTTHFSLFFLFFYIFPHKYTYNSQLPFHHQHIDKSEEHRQQTNVKKILGISLTPNHYTTTPNFINEKPLNETYFPTQQQQTQTAPKGWQREMTREKASKGRPGVRVSRGRVERKLLGGMRSDRKSFR